MDFENSPARMRRHVPEGTLTPEQVLEGGKKTYFEKTPTSLKR